MNNLEVKEHEKKVKFIIHHCRNANTYVVTDLHSKVMYSGESNFVQLFNTGQDTDLIPVFREYLGEDVTKDNFVVASDYNFDKRVHEDYLTQLSMSSIAMSSSDSMCIATSSTPIVNRLHTFKLYRENVSQHYLTFHNGHTVQIQAVDVDSALVRFNDLILKADWNI